MENRSCQAYLMVFIDEITSLDDGGNCVGLKYLDFFCSFWWPFDWENWNDRKSTQGTLNWQKKIANWCVSNCKFNWKTTTEYVTTTLYYIHNLNTFYTKGKMKLFRICWAMKNRLSGTQWRQLTTVYVIQYAEHEEIYLSL